MVCELPKWWHFTWRGVAEDDIVAAAAASCPEFQQFYDAEIRAIAPPILWAYAPYLSPDAALQSDGRTQVILVKKVPNAYDDVVIVAEELQHALMERQGFPALSAQVNTLEGNLAAVLNSMVHDPLAISRLLPYGFKVRSNYDRNAASGLQEIEKYDAPGPEDPILRMLFRVHFVSDVLDWEIVRHSGEGTSSDFQAQFAKKFPVIAREAEELLALTKRLEFDTPKKMSALFEEVIRKYRLRDAVKGPSSDWTG